MFGRPHQGLDDLLGSKDKFSLDFTGDHGILCFHELLSQDKLKSYRRLLKDELDFLPIIPYIKLQTTPYKFDIFFSKVKEFWI